MAEFDVPSASDLLGGGAGGGGAEDVLSEALFLLLVSGMLLWTWLRCLSVVAVDPDDDR